MVLSSFSILELVLDLMVAWVPGYLIAKCVFLVWCMAPVQNNGSNIIFNMVSYYSDDNNNILTVIHRLFFLSFRSIMIRLTV